jgi:hypothetical protein
MATITTKFSIGDVVYAAEVATERRQRPCPDCLGTRKWKAASPAGEEYEFGCPRCSTGYMSNDALSLDYTVHVPNVQVLTIGQVRVVNGEDAETGYMCRETGVGSGQVWREDVLFATREEATAAAEVTAKARDLSVSWVKKLFDKTLGICDYQLSNAAKKAADDARYAFDARVQMLFEDLRDAQDNAEVLDAIDRYRTRVQQLEAA